MNGAAEGQREGAPGSAPSGQPPMPEPIQQGRSKAANGGKYTAKGDNWHNAGLINNEAMLIWRQ